MATVTGTDGHNTLAGTDGGDTIYGKWGNDTINGGGGNDLIYGNTAADAAGTSLSDWDTIDAGDGNDTAYGGQGKDILYGRTGADTLYGGFKDDGLYGGWGADRLYGGAANDLLDGGEGSDILTGGSGQDSFVFFDGDGADRITDFTIGQDSLQINGTTIDLSDLSTAPTGITYTSSSTGNLVVNYGSGDRITVDNISYEAVNGVVTVQAGAGNYMATDEIVSGDMFGGIPSRSLYNPYNQQSSVPWNSYDLMQYMGLDHVRHFFAEPDFFKVPDPGEVFPTLHEIAMDTSRAWNRTPLSDILSFANETGKNATIIIPDARFTGVGGIESGKTQVREFVEELFKGTYGPLPKKLIFEIGNEFGGFTNDVAGFTLYGQIAAAFTLEIDALREQYANHPDFDTDISIAIQMGPKGLQTDGFDAAIRDGFGQSPGAFEAVDAVVTHRLLVGTNNADIDADNIRNAITAWEQQGSGGVGGLDYYASAITVGSLTVIEALENYVKSYFKTSNELPEFVNGLPGVTNDEVYEDKDGNSTRNLIIQKLQIDPKSSITELLNRAAAEIVERSNVGFEQSRQDQYLARDYGLAQASGMIERIYEALEIGADAAAYYGIAINDPGGYSIPLKGGAYNPAAEAMRMMTESLVGTHALAEHAVNGVTTTNSRFEASMVHAFEDDAKVVVFISANDFDGDHLDIDLDILGLTGGYSYAWAESLTSSLDENWQDKYGVVNIQENIGVDQSPESRIYQTGDIQRDADGGSDTFEINNDGSVSLRFTQDYQVIRLIFAKNNPGEGYLHLWGDESNDAFTGGSSDDLLEGNKGNDTLTGGSGGDTFRFVTGDGADVITDFNIAEDALIINGNTIDLQNLPSGVTIIGAGAGTVVSYGTGDQITLTGVSISDNYDATLFRSLEETGSYGNSFDGQTDADGSVSFIFDGNAGENMSLNFAGFDIDTNTEVELFLNDQSLGFLNTGADQSLADYSYTLAGSRLSDGANVLRFEQQLDDNYAWGVTDLLVGPAADATLFRSLEETGSYGNSFDGQTDADGSVSFIFDGNAGENMSLNFAGFDIDTNTEVELFLNDQSLGFLNTGADQSLADYSYTLAGSRLSDGANVLRFEQQLDDNYAWGVTDLLVGPAADATLFRSLEETGSYGNSFDGQTDADGSVSFIFDGNAGENMSLNFAGFDIDTNTEVELFLNDQSLGFLNTGADQSLADYSYTLAGSRLSDGANVLRFEQQLDDNYAWGVTDLLVGPAADATLFRSLEETGSYGNSFDGQTDADGSVSFIFDGNAGENMSLNFAGFDIDTNTEVELFLNDQSLGFLNTGADQSLADYSYTLAGSRLSDGANVLRFEQQLDDNYAWGVTDLLVGPAADATLFRSLEETGSYGNSFDGQTDADGSVSFIFDGNAGENMSLNFAGFDIDTNTEVELFLNDQSLGFLNTGADQSLADYSYTLAGSRLSDGANVLRFEQQLDDNYAWGVTDLLVGPAADATLFRSLEETGSYGNSFDGQTDADGSVSFIFDGNAGENMSLNFAGFDIDTNTEVELFLNDQSLGFLNTGADQSLADYSYTLAGSRLSDGANVLRFEQQLDDNYAWGVTDLLVGPAADATLFRSLEETGSYGNSFDGQTDADGSVSFIFDGNAGENMSLNFAGFDIDTNTEVELFLNDQSLGFLNTGADQSLADYSYTLAGSRLSDGANVLRFEQQLDDNYAWGVTDLLVGPAADATLFRSLEETGSYGNSFDGQTDADGSVSFIFDGNAGENMSLNFAGFDIDTNTEVELFLNDQSLGFLNTGADQSLADYSYTLAGSRLSDGANVLRFEQQLDDNYAWGVTDLLVGDEFAFL